MKPINQPLVIRPTQSYRQFTQQPGQTQYRQTQQYVPNTNQHNIQQTSHQIVKPVNSNTKQQPVKNLFFQEQLQQMVKIYQFPQPYIKYKIMCAQDDKLTLDVTTVDRPKQQLKKGNLIVWEYHGGPNQHWYIKNAGESKNFYIINCATGFTLQVPDASQKDQVQIHTNPRNGEKNQIWQIVNCGKDLYKIKSFCGKVLDVSSAWIRDGSKVIQYEDHDGKNQKWKIWPS